MPSTAIHQKTNWEFTWLAFVISREVRRRSYALRMGHVRRTTRHLGEQNGHVVTVLDSSIADLGLPTRWRRGFARFPERHCVPPGSGFPGTTWPIDAGQYLDSAASSLDKPSGEQPEKLEHKSYGPDGPHGPLRRVGVRILSAKVGQAIVDTAEKHLQPYQSTIV